MLTALFNTTDKLQLVSGSAATFDVVVTYTDLIASTGAFSKTDRQVTAITTATTTDILAVPAADRTRGVNSIFVRNKHASVPSDVTIVYDANGTDYELHKVTLQPGDLLEFIEGIGWFTIAAKAPGVIKLASDQSNSTTTLTEVTGLSTPVGVGSWAFTYFLLHQSGATTTGTRWSVNHDGTVTSFVANVGFAGGTTASVDAPDQDLVAAGAQLKSYFSARAKSTTGWGTTLSVDTANADMLTTIEGLMVVSVAGNIELWHGAEVAAISTVKAGSILVLQGL